MAERQKAGQATVITRDPYAGAHGAVLKAVDDYATRQVTDPFADFYGAGVGRYRIIEPTLNPLELIKLPVSNNTLDQCIDAMVTNVEGFGYTLEFIGKPEEKESKAALAEKEWIEDLVKHPNPEQSLVFIRKRMRRDFETLGYAYIEVGRDNAGNVAFLYHLPAHSVRKTVVDDNATPVTVKLKRGDQWVSVTIQKRFCRFVQLAGTRTIYFKELGDPRRIDPGSGDPASGEPDASATEVFMFSRYVTGDAYGMPRYINNLPAVLGSRESEVTNLQFFRDNAIPALAVLVAGGQLTQASVDAIRNAFNQRGLDALNRVLILEAQASSDMVGAEAASPVPRIELKPLGGERQNDALFQEYDKNNQIKIRGSFRIPPLLVGLSEDYTRATAEAAIDTAEAQVFAPERSVFDEVMNQSILARGGVPPTFWRFRSNPSKIVGGETVMKSMETLDKVGAMTPNIAIRMMNELFGTALPVIEEEWGDLPIALVKQLVAKGQLGIGDIPAAVVVDPETDADAAGAKKPQAAPKPKPVEKGEVTARTRLRPIVTARIRTRDE